FRRRRVERHAPIVASCRVVHRDQHLAHSGRQPIVAFLFFVARSAKVDDEAHAESLELRQVTFGGLAEVGTTEQHTTTNTTSIGRGTTTEVAEVDDLLELDIT